MEPVTLGEQLTNKLTKAESLFGQIVVTVESPYEDMEIDVWSSKEFLSLWSESEEEQRPFRLLALQVTGIPAKTTCVVTDIYTTPCRTDLFAVEVISSTGVCGWVNSWDVIHVKT